MKLTRIALAGALTAALIAALIAALATTPIVVAQLHHSVARPEAAKVKVVRRSDPIEAASHGRDVAYLASLAAAGGSDAAHSAAALGRVTGAEAAPALHALAVDTTQPVLVRANAIHALASCADAAQTRSLVTLAVDPTEPPRIRQEAALALRARGTPNDVDALAAALERAAVDPSAEAEQIRISLVQALRAIGSEPARAAIARHAARHLSATEHAFVTAKT